MKRFHFSLRAVHLMRRKAYEAARTRWVEALQLTQTCKQRLGELTGALQQTEAATAEARLGHLGAPQLVQQHHGLSALRAEQDTLLEALNEATAALETARKAYVEAHQTLEVVERVEATQRAAHMSEQQRRQEQELEELITLRGTHSL